MKLAVILALTVIGFCLLVLFLAYLSYRMAFYSSPKRKNDPFSLPKEEKYQAIKERMKALIAHVENEPYEDVTILSRDGLTLYARYYHHVDGAPLKIQFHGYRSMAVRDYCGGYEMTEEAGFNLLLVDQRAHGKSGGRTITMGIKERYDCLDWITYANKRFGEDTPIFLYGLSMGAATILMASELALPSNVLGIAADCPYSSPRDIVLRVAREDMHIPAFIAAPLLSLGSRLFGHFSLREASAEEAVKHAKIPILIVHGEADSFVPCDMSRKIVSAAATPAFLMTVEEAPHGICYLMDTARYRQRVREFTAFCFEYRKKEQEKHETPT